LHKPPEIDNQQVYECALLRSWNKADLLYLPGSQFTDEAFTFHSACTKLVVLSAADVQISDFKVAELTQRWRDLRVLVLAGCRQLTELAVESIAKHSEVLGNLSLSGCVLVQDEAVKLLGNKIGKTLMWLNLAGTGISDDSIIVRYILQACLPLILLIVVSVVAIKSLPISPIPEH
jgi:hypothetical protein